MKFFIEHNGNIVISQISELFEGFGTLGCQNKIITTHFPSKHLFIHMCVTTFYVGVINVTRLSKLK